MFSLRLLVLSLSLRSHASAAVFSPQSDAEVAELHAAMEEGFQRINNLTGELQAAGAIAAPSTGYSGPGSQQHVVAPQAAARKVDPSKIAGIRKLETDFSALQQLAFRIGRESEDNQQLSQHPDINNYIQSLREFRPRLEDMINDLEKELRSITGKQVEKPKKRRKAAKTIQGLAEEDIRTRVRQTLASDSRAFRTKAMDFVSTFRERQLQMQDKQRDLQLAMDGPDWPKEDWPLSTSDAKHVGEAEQMIQAALQVLTGKIEKDGGLARVHESGDETVLEQLATVSEMMSGYGELIDRHVEAVKKVYRGKKRRKAKASSNVASPSATSIDTGASLRDRLLNFGSPQGGQQQPFAWLRNDAAGSQATPGGFATPGSFGQMGSGAPSFGTNPGATAAPMPADSRDASSSLSKLAGLSSSLGSLGALGGVQASPPSHSPPSVGALPVNDRGFGGWGGGPRFSEGHGEL